MNEEQLLLAYEPKLNCIVKSFMKRATTGRTSREDDLMQEARLAFLQHVRTHEPDEYDRCYLTILHALCEAVRRDYPLSISRRDFFNQEKPSIHLCGMEKAEDIETLEGLIEAAELRCSLEAVLSNSTEQVKVLVYLKEIGYTNKQAGVLLGMSDCQVTRALKKIRFELFIQ